MYLKIAALRCCSLRLYSVVHKVFGAKTLLAKKLTCLFNFGQAPGWICLYAALFTLSFALTVQAQETKKTTLLSLSEAISHTLAEHPDLAIFAQQRLVLDANVQMASIAQRPQIGLTIEDAMGTGEHRYFDSAQTTLSIAWVLQQDLINSRVQAAKSGLTQVDFAQETKALDLAAHTAGLFIESLVFEQRSQLAKLALQQANAAFQATKRRVDAGKSLLTEQLQAEAEVVRRELDVEDVEHEWLASRYQLVAQWGGNVDDYQPSGDLLNIPIIGNLNSQLEKLKQHPALQAFANQQRIAQSEMELARIESEPVWQITAGLRRYESSDDFALVAGISMPWGKDTKSAAKIAALSAQQTEYQLAAQSLSRRLNTQLFVIMQHISHRQHVIETLTKRVIPLLEQAVTEASQAYEIGRIGYTQWVMVRQELVAIQTELLDAYQAIHLQHIEIQRLTGASLSN